MRIRKCHPPDLQSVLKELVVGGVMVMVRVMAAAVVRVVVVVAAVPRAGYSWS